MSRRRQQRSPSDTETSPLKPRPWFGVVLIGLPILFFVLLEFGLRVGGYGHDLRQWIEIAPGKLMLNTEIGRRYFHKVRILPVSNQDIFDAQKRPEAFRVFVLGGSSGAGYPYAPNGAFSRWMRTELEVLYPGRTIEVVNLSMTAINSYTLRDLFPGVLEQAPDLVVIYAGHNEYYGALGVGSSESAGLHPSLVRFSLLLGRLKTYQLLRDVMTAVATRIGGPKPPPDGTLMSRMVKDQSIPYLSPSFHRGLEQFEENIRDMLLAAQEQRVPVIFGELVSNLREQTPFISAPEADSLSATRVFGAASLQLKNGALGAADSLFRYAKDLDQLRFRAPEAMNGVIRRLGREFNAPVVPFDSLFAARSPFGIVGDNLMTDHLHPTLEGYRLMGHAYVEAMRGQGWLPAGPARTLSPDSLDELTRRSFVISRLDSVLGHYRIALLKNDWPYVSKRERRSPQEVLGASDEVERAAASVVLDERSWEAAHRHLAEWYLAKRDYEAFVREMNVLVTQFPIVVEFSDFAANELLKAERYDDAEFFLRRRHELQPSAYSAKWIGIILLSRQQVGEAVQYLEQSLRTDRSDAQALYNLAGAYALSKDYTKALTIIEECLKVDPQFPKAEGLRQQLLRASRR